MIQPDILLVSQSMYKTADKVLNTKILTRCGNYIRGQLRNEKPYWYKGYGSLLVGNKTNLNDLIRDGWDGYSEIPENFSLPRAMKKRGYRVKYKYIGYGEYNKTIEKIKV